MNSKTPPEDYNNINEKLSISPPLPIKRKTQNLQEFCILCLLNMKNLKNSNHKSSLLKGNSLQKAQRANRHLKANQQKEQHLKMQLLNNRI